MLLIAVLLTMNDEFISFPFQLYEILAFKLTEWGESLIIYRCE